MNAMMVVSRDFRTVSLLYGWLCHFQGVNCFLTFVLFFPCNFLSLFLEHAPIIYLCCVKFVTKRWTSEVSVLIHIELIILSLLQITFYNKALMA